MHRHLHILRDREINTGSVTYTQWLWTVHQNSMPMTVVRVVVILIIAIPVITDDIDSFNIGCHQVTPDSKDLSVGGGNYHFNLISVKQCVALCKSLEQSYAVCQAGRLCRCGSDVAQMQNVSEANCDIRCSGEVLDMCGGSGGFVNVYSTEKAVKSLSIVDPGVIELYLPVIINTSLEAGHESVAYSYDWGDGVRSPDYTAAPQPHVYTDEGIYLVKTNASNNFSGPIEARLNVHAESPVKDIQTWCDPFVEVGFSFTCWSSFGQGTNVAVEWDFGDDEEPVVIPMSDAQRFSAGPAMPHHLDHIAAPLGLQGAYIAPALSFNETGKIEAWEVFASREGQVKLQVYRPLCGLHERYCAFNKSCISRFSSCLPPSERSCQADTEAFCLISQRCHPFTTEYVPIEKNVTVSGICEDGIDTTTDPFTSFMTTGTLMGSTSPNYGTTNREACNETYWEIVTHWEPVYHTEECRTNQSSLESWPGGYSLVGEKLVYLREGYNIFGVTPSQRIQVEAGDVIGFSTYRERFPSYYPKAAYPLVGEVALSPDTDSKVYVITQPLHRSFDVLDVTETASLSGGLYLRARASAPSFSSLIYSYQSSGMFAIKTGYTNALPLVFDGPTVTIASQYRILSVSGTQFTRDLGRYYACTDEVFNMHVEVDQGTYVRLDWTFPDGEHNLTAPYIHNGIVDGPGVKTPDQQGFLFYEIGNYTTSVLAYNNVSWASVELETIARYRIKGLHGFIINAAEDNTTQAWNLTLAGTWHNVSSLITSGNEVEYLWDYGDGSDSIPWDPATTYSHYFVDPGIYTVLVKADNIASTMDYAFQVEAVKANRVLAPSYVTSELAFEIVCDVTWHTGEGLTFQWEFGDGNITVVEDINWVLHDFDTYSQYGITCTILNFPYVMDTFLITDQDPVEGVKLQNITEVKATGDEVEFVVTRTRGNDVQFHWYFGEGEVDVETDVPETVHIYSRTGFYNVTVNVSNIVSWMMSPPLTIELQERITNLRVDSANNIIFAEVSATAFFDTGNKVFFNFFFGDGVNVSSSSSSRETHRYSYPALYTITLFAYNAVSSQTANTQVLIDSRITRGKLLVVTPWIRAEEVTADCLAMNGSSVWMTFDWGDGQVTGPFEADFIGTGSSFSGTHTYSQEGTFNVTCYMENDWSDAVAKTKVLLQEAITVLEFTPTVTVKGDIFWFTVLPFPGDGHDILFNWNYNDGSFFTTDQFSHQYVYTTAGIYFVKLTAHNLVSTKIVTQQVYVQEHVEGLYLSPVYPVEPGQPTIIIWQIEHGTDVEYEVDLGDGTPPTLFQQADIGKGWTLEYIYSTPGSYQLTLTAFNKLNSLNQSAMVHVEYPIQGLRAFIHGNSTVHTDKSAFIFISVDQGTNVVYTCEFGDGSAPLVTTKNVCRHMFIDLGYHLVSVFAENHLSQAFTLANQSYDVILPPIPQRIENLKITAEESTILGQVTVFRMSRTRGNRYNCTWDYGDGHYDLMDQSMVFDNFSHTFENAGRYQVMINCSNFFSRPVVAYTSVTVQEPVRGLNFTSSLMGQFGESLNVTVSLEGGTNASAAVHFSGGVFPVTMTGLEGVVVIPGERVNVTGWQVISVLARNMVPPELNVTTKIYIEAQISNLVMWTDTPYVTIGSVVTFNVAFDLGTDISLEWYFGDNVVLETFIQESRGEVFTSEHLYTEEGLYAAFVVARNRINEVFNTPLLIVVEDPVQGFHVQSTTPVRYPDGVVNFTITWNVNTRALPDNTSIVIDLGTGEQPTEIPLDSVPSFQYYKMNNVCVEYAAEVQVNPLLPSDESCEAILDELFSFLDGQSLLVMEISKQYEPGVYPAVITVGNMASQQEFKFSVETQIPVSGCVAMSCLMDNSDCRPGGGPDGLFFPLEEPVVFGVTCVNGTGMMYNWLFGDGHRITGTESQASHDYEIPGSYDLRIITGNIFGWEIMTLSVNIQESVIGLFISQGPVTSGNISIIVFALQPGSESMFNLTIPAIGLQEIMETPSFNSTLRDKAMIRWNQDAHIPFNISTVAMSFHEVSFPSAGLWEVIVTGTNYASEATVHGFVSVSEESCDLPSINILGIGENFREPVTFHGNQEILMMAEVGVACPQTKRLGLTWRIYPLMTYGNALLPPDNSSAIDLPSSIVTSAVTFNLDPGVLHYGQYTVELTTTLDNDGKVSNKKLAFLEVVPSELVATISGGEEETIEEGSFFTIDGSGSGDPDEGIYDDIDEAVTIWYCHLGNETIDLRTGDINGNGCFGNGLGRITNGTVALSYWTANLTRYQEFVFTLLVKRDDWDTMAVATKTIRVDPGVSYPLSVRCLKNCLSKVNPSMELVLAGGCDCEANETDVSFTWEVTGLERDYDMVHYSTTGFQSPYLQLSPSLFTDSSERSFAISLDATIGSLHVGHVKYIYHIADMLIRGTCVISPNSGTALFTEFDISCEGFSSSEPPLIYRYLLSRDNPVTDSTATFSLLSMSPGSQASSLSLPAGYQRNDYRVYIRVQVKDAIGVTATVDLRTQVLPADSANIIDQLSFIESGSPGLVDLAVGKEDQQRATSLITDLAESMNEDPVATDGRNLTKESKEVVRSSMVSTLDEVKILTLDLGRQTTAALSAVIAEPDEIDIETQSKAIEIYSDILDMAQQGSESDPETAREIYQNFLAGATSLLEASAIHAQRAMELIPAPTEPPREVTSESSDMMNIYPRMLEVFGGVNDASPEEEMYLEQMREVRDGTERVIEMLEMVGNLIVQSELPTESPVMVHRSETVMMSVQKVTTLQAKNRLYTMPDGSWLRLPAEVIESLKDQAENNEIITQMYSFPNNPFTWHDSDVNILTSVIGFTLKNTRGEKLHVSGLTDNVEVLLPRGGQSALKFDTMTAFSHELITVSFNVSEPSSSIHIDIYPTDLDRGSQLEAYLRFGFLPSMNSYDLKTTLPSEVTIMPFNQSANFTANPYTWFIPEDRLYAVGSYYLSVRVVNNGGTRMTNETLQGVDVDVKIYTARCMFWSEIDQLWLPDGCQVGSMTTSSFTHCLCDHLTFIGGTFSVPPNQQVVFEEEKEVVVDPIMSDLVTYISGLLVAVAVICFIVACVADVISRRKMFKDLEMLDDLYVVKLFTGLGCDATSTAKVFLVLQGENGKTNPTLLTNSDMHAFREGSVDIFLVPTPKNLGDIVKITVWQDGHGYSPAWHLSRVIMEHYQSGKQWLFLCNTKIVKPNRARTFSSALNYNTVKYRHLFSTESLMEDLSSKIPLLSLLIKPCHDVSTYKERVCAFFASLSIASLLTTLLKALMAKPVTVTNAFSFDMDSVIDGGMIGGATLLVYFLLYVAYRSLQPRLPGRPRSAGYQETANDDEPDVKLKNVKRITSLGDVTIQPKKESVVTSLLLSEGWDNDSETESSFHNAPSGVNRRSGDLKKSSNWPGDPAQSLGSNVTSLSEEKERQSSAKMFAEAEPSQRVLNNSCHRSNRWSDRIKNGSDWSIPSFGPVTSTPKVSAAMNIHDSNVGKSECDWTIPTAVGLTRDDSSARVSMNAQHQGLRNLASKRKSPCSGGDSNVNAYNHQKIVSSTHKWTFPVGNADQNEMGDAGMDIHEGPTPAWTIPAGRRVNNEWGDTNMNIHYPRSPGWTVPSNSDDIHKRHGNVLVNIHNQYTNLSISAPDWPVTARSPVSSDSNLHINVNMHDPATEKQRNDWARSSGIPVRSINTDRTGDTTIHGPGSIELRDWTIPHHGIGAEASVRVEDIFVDMHDSDRDISLSSESELPECDRTRGAAPWNCLPGTVEQGDENVEENYCGDGCLVTNVSMIDYGPSRGNVSADRNACVRERKSPLSEERQDRSDNIFVNDGMSWKGSFTLPAGTGKTAKERIGQTGASSNVSTNNANITAEIPSRHVRDSANISTNNSNATKEVRFQATERPPEPRLSVLSRISEFCFRASHRHRLPWWLSFLLVPMMFALIPVSFFGTFTLTFSLYSLDMTYQWITTFGTALVLFLCAPILVACMSSFVVGPLRRPCSIEVGSQVFQDNHKASSGRSRAPEAKRFDTAKLLSSHTIVSTERGLIWQILSHVLWLLFLAMLGYLVLQQRSTSDFYTIKGIKDVFCTGDDPSKVSFYQATNLESFWDWSEELLIPALMPSGPEEDEYPFIVLSTPRMRQFRVDPSKADACRKLSPTDRRTSNCTLNWQTEDRRQYLNSWTSLITSDTLPHRDQGYHYNTPAEMPGATAWGSMGSYHSGGYVVEIPPELSTAQYILRSLKAKRWLDQNTQAILVEMSVYNANIGMINVVQFLLESSPTGYLIPSIDIRCLHLEGDPGLWKLITQCLEVLLVVVAMAFLIQELGMVHIEGGSYYSDLGCVMGLLMMIATFAAAMTSILHRLAMNKISLAAPDFGELYSLSSVSDWYTTSLALAIFMVIVKQITILNLTKPFLHFSPVLKRTSMALIAALPFFIIFIVGSMWTAWMLFSGILNDFRTHFSGFLTLINARLGNLGTSEAYQDFPLPMFIMVYTALCGIFGLIAFSAVAMQSYSAVKVRHAFECFIQHGKVTKILQDIKSKLMVRKTIRKVRRRKRIVVRGYRKWRNEQPMDRRYLKRIIRSEKKAGHLLAACEGDNDFMVRERELLVDALLRIYDEWRSQGVRVQGAGVHPEHDTTRV